MKAGKKHLMWIVELLIWLVILAVLAGSVFFVHYETKKMFSTYQIFMPDVDGLVKGSAVRMMGIQVGYVTNTKIIGDDVYVKFRITEKNVKVPQGARATVEFSGLGGSKTLELYPPNSDSIASQDYITVERPKRLHDSLSLLNDMFEKLGSITYRFSYFFDKTGIITTTSEKKEVDYVKKSDTYLNETNKWLDKQDRNRGKLDKKIKELKNGI